MPRKGEFSGEFVQCMVCGKEVYKDPTRLKRSNGRHFCSVECQGIQRHIDSYEMRKCEVCDTMFEASKKSSKRFCSPRCQSEWQKTQIGAVNKRYDRIHKQCEYCGADIFVIPYRLKDGRKLFCDAKCRQKWYSTVYSQSEEWRIESQKRAVRILNSGVMSNINTKPQKIIDDMLSSKSIEFIKEYSVTYYAMDNYLTESGLFIEVMGDFWHCNPLVYDEVKYKQQKAAVRRDKAKHTYVKTKFGKEILYIWESDIIDRPDLCSQLIDLYVNNNGILDNYHSFNYDIDRDGIFVVSDLVEPY